MTASGRPPRRILILGAGVYQVPLITAARSRGLETVVLSRAGDYPGCALADSFLPVDIADPAACLQVAREQGICAVATAGADAGLPALGLIVSELGLPGPQQHAAEASADKTRMKAAFVKGGVPSARFGLFTQPAEAVAFATEIGYPVMVKPPDSSGSRGVFRADDDRSLLAVWPAAMDIAGFKILIVEKCLLGTEYGAQAVVHGDRVVAVFVHDDLVTAPPVSTPVGHAMPSSLSSDAIRKTETAVVQAVAALGLRDCVANVDLMLVGGEPHVIEIGGRMGATGIPEVIGTVTGLNMYDQVLDLALGTSPSLTPSPGPAAAVTLLRGDATGRVLALEVPAEVRDHPDLIALAWDIRPGDRVRAFRTGPDRLGQLQTCGPDARSALAVAEELRTRIRIIVEESA